jgi:hypothetical protein
MQEEQQQEDFCIYEEKASYVLGFHGCDKETAEALLKNDTPTFKLSRNYYDWLGSGMYFWENDPFRALEFIGEVKTRESGRIIKPAVIGAVIDLGNCLDLAERKYTDLVKDAYIEYKEFTEKKGLLMPSNKDGFNGDKDMVLRNLDRAVIEFLHETIKKKNKKPFDTVRCMFLEGEELYDGSGFRKKTHIQIAVRNPDMIKGYFRPIQYHQKQA